MRRVPELCTCDRTQKPKKQFWGFLGGLAGSLISGAFGSAANDATNAQNWDVAKLNYKSQQETNQWNRLIAQESNKANLELQNDMNDFNLRMWNLNNEYNSPTQQLQRAASAGINPNVVFGQPVASSPVQQTSIPNQVTPHMEAPLMHFNPVTKGKYKFLQELGNMFAKLPFNKESLDILKEEARGKRVENDAREYELQGKKDADAFYNGAAFYRKHDGSFITGDDFEKLSDDEKKSYLNQEEPYVTINGEKKPNYDAYRLPFRNKAEFEAYKDVLNFPNFKANISADMQQNKLREAVAKGQLQNNDVVKYLIDMPAMQYKQIYHSLQKLIQENNWNEETHAIRKHILELNEKQIENAVDHDIFTYIDKIIAQGDMTVSDWFKLAFSALASFVHR